MNFSMCHVEVFLPETQHWEYTPVNPFPEPINCWYNNLDFIFHDFNLYFLLTALENENREPSAATYKELPADCSETILNAHHFYFEEIRRCREVSFLDLMQLLTFDYDTPFSLKGIPEIELELLAPELPAVKKEHITHREWLGDDFFSALQEAKVCFEKYSKCRLIYFLYAIDLTQ